MWARVKTFFLNSKYDQGKNGLFLALVCRYVNKNHYRHTISLEEIWELEFCHVSRGFWVIHQLEHIHTQTYALSHFMYMKDTKSRRQAVEEESSSPTPNWRDLGPCQQLGTVFWLLTPWSDLQSSLCNNAAQTERKAPNKAFIPSKSFSDAAAQPSW